MIDELSLLSGQDIPIPQIGIAIHPPTLKEIGLLGQSFFYSSISIFLVTHDSFGEENKAEVEDMTNFDIILEILNSNNFYKIKQDTLLVLQLILPLYSVEFVSDKIILRQEEQEVCITNQNFDCFKEVVVKLFCLDGQEDDEFNPATKGAEEIAAKIRKGREKARHNQNEKNDILSRMASIVAVGMNLNLNDVLNFTIYQLFNIVKRYNLKVAYDRTTAILLAGGEIAEKDKADDWTKSL